MEFHCFVKTKAETMAWDFAFGMGMVKGVWECVHYGWTVVVVHSYMGGWYSSGR